MQALSSRVREVRRTDSDQGVPAGAGRPDKDIKIVLEGNLTHILTQTAGPYVCLKLCLVPVRPGSLKLLSHVGYSRIATPLANLNIFRYPYIRVSYNLDLPPHHPQNIAQSSSMICVGMAKHDRIDSRKVDPQEGSVMYRRYTHAGIQQDLVAFCLHQDAQPPLSKKSKLSRILAQGSNTNSHLATSNRG